MTRIFLNIGCGEKKIPGFLNIHLGAGADMRVDVTKGLPFESNSVDGIFSEHFIEHLSQAECAAFLRECRRVLVPGGIVRIATPDLDEIVRSYESAWREQAWIRDFGYGWIDNRAEMMNIAMREWGHRWLYNEEELVRLAGYAGLTTPRRRKIGESDEAMLAGREYREDSKLVVEFTKRRRLEMVREPLVSILIPAYNPRYFAIALESALAQTYRAVEIIVSDDCPTGEIENILSPYRKSDKRIKYVKHGKQDAYNNYLHCFSLATGEFIKFLNDDDVLHPECVERMLDCFRKYSDITLVTSHRQRIDAAGNHLPDIPATKRIVEQDSIISGESLARALLERCVNFIGEPSTAMFRKSDMSDAKPNLLSFAGRKVTYNVDVAVWLSLLSKGDAVYLVDTMSFFRQHPEQQQAQDGAAESGDRTWEQLKFDGRRMGFFGHQAPRQLATQSLVQDEASAPAVPMAPMVRKKKASIIIPVYNNWEYTQQCLLSLEAEGYHQQAEVIVVDNASTDATTRGLKSEFPWVEVIRNEQNLGFAKACNRGAETARGKYLVFLNNDTKVQKGWLEALIAAYEGEPGTGIVGSKLLYPDGRLQHAGMEIVYPGGASPIHTGHLRYGQPDAPDARREVDAVTGAAILVPRAVFYELGGFEEVYENGCEDVDLCLKARAGGYRILYEPASRAIHYESKTPGRFDNEITNINIFHRRWLPYVLQHFRKASCLQETQPSNRPPVSIIIVTHNSRATIAACLESVLATTTESDEIVVVDNNSQDETSYYVECLQKVLPAGRVQLHCETANIGYAGGAARGEAIASREIRVLLNPDTVVSPGWLEGLPQFQTQSDSYSNLRQKRPDAPLLIWNAPIFDPSGYADEARQLIKRVAAGWPIRVEPAGRSSEKFAHSMQPDERQFFYSLMKIPPQREFIRLIHLPGVAFHRDPHAFCNIGRTVFETDRLPSSWVARCNSMDEIWVPTEFNAQAFRRSGVRVPLHVVPEGVDASFFTTGAKPLHIPGKRSFAFLSIFEWTFRKGWDLLLKAWAETFRQDEDVCLILRSYPIDAIESDTAQKVIEHRISQFLQETLRKSLRETAPIIVLGEQIPANQMPRLYAAADAFVLPSRGEGWGRPYIEAMACGLPVIGTRWGGNMAFMNDDNSYLLDINGLEEVDDRMEFPFYLGHRWASPSLEQLKTLMRRLFDHPEEARNKGLTARAHVSTYWTWERASEVAMERLRDISRRRNRKPSQSIYPDLVRKKDRLSVVWEGSQFVHHSLALVNREVCLRLADRKDVTLSIIPYESHQFGADADTRFPKLERLFNLRPDSSVDIHVRHQWPPNFIPPFEGHWVMIQPWEYGRLPREWIAPMSSLVDEIWVPSRHVWKTYVASGVPQEQVHIVPNGVDSRIFRPEAKPVPLPTRKSFKFLFVGGTIWRKGVDILLEAYRSVFHRNDDVTLIIKDMGQDSFYQGQGAGHLIRSIQEDPNAPEIVYLTDMYSGQQMPGLFTACNCLVHPYRGEGFGLPVLEAMACGLPVIVTAGGGTDDFCSPQTVFQIGAKRIPFTSPSLELAGGAGWVLQPDVEDLKQVLRHVFENVWDAKTRAQRALEHVRNGHTWDHVAAKIAERIQCIAERPIRRFTANVRERLE